VVKDIISERREERKRIPDFGGGQIKEVESVGKLGRSRNRASKGNRGKASKTGWGTGLLGLAKKR